MVEGHRALLERDAVALRLGVHFHGALIGSDAALLVLRIAVGRHGGQLACLVFVFVEALLQHDDALAVAARRDEVNVLTVVFLAQVQFCGLAGLGIDDIVCEAAVEDMLHRLGRAHPCIALAEGRSVGIGTKGAAVFRAHIPVAGRVIHSEVAVREAAHAAELELMGGEVVNLALVARIADTFAVVEEQAHVGVKGGDAVVLQRHDLFFRGVEDAVFVIL